MKNKFNYTLHLVYNGVLILKISSKCLHDIYSYLDYIISNYRGTCLALIYKDDVLFSRFRFKCDRFSKKIPFPFTLSFKRKRISDKQLILKKYGYM